MLQRLLEKLSTSFESYSHLLAKSIKNLAWQELERDAIGIIVNIQLIT